jgi:oligopeptide transport system substrate-binding protein
MTAMTAMIASISIACSISRPDGATFGRVSVPDPTHFTWCNSDEPEYLDPGLAQATNDLKVVEELFDGLTTYDRNALATPSLATSWSMSPDRTRFTFHLRGDARWSNGRPLVAADFVYSWARVLHPFTASRNADTLWRLRHGRAYSAGTARLVLADAPPFHAGDAVRIDDPGRGGGEGDRNAGADADGGSNLRRGRAGAQVPLWPDAHRPQPGGAGAGVATGSQPWAVASPGADLTIIETTPDRAWAYLYTPAVTSGEEGGGFGWAPLADLEEPNRDRRYPVVSLDDDRRGTVRGHDLLMVPEVLGVSAPDDRTLVVELENPVPYFLDVTLQRTLRPVPREAVSRWPRRWTRPEHIVTSGPFHLVAWRQRDKLELRRSTTFWGRDRVRLERVTVLSMNDQAANANVYYQGGCDALVANNIPASYLPALAGRSDHVTAAQLGIYVYMINVKRFGNVHFRRALSHALDRSRLPILLRGGQIPTEAYVPGKPIAQLGEDELRLCGVTRDAPGVALQVVKDELCYVPPLGPRYDPAAARREMDQARRELGAAFPAKINLRFNTGVEQHKTVAEWLQAEWGAQLGLTVELEAQDWKTYLKATADHEYDLAKMTWNGNFPDPEAEFLEVFRCGSADNRPGFCDPEFERLYAEAEKEGDRARRLAIIRRAEALMIDQVPIVPLYVYTQHVLIKPYVRDLFVNLTDHQSLRETWIQPQ